MRSKAWSRSPAVGDRLSFAPGGELALDVARAERGAGGGGRRQSRAQGGARARRAYSRASAWALSISIRGCRSRPGSAAVRPTPARRCGLLARANGLARRRSAALRGRPRDRRRRAGLPLSAHAVDARHRRNALRAAEAAATAGGARPSRRRAGDEGGVCRMDACRRACGSRSTSRRWRNWRAASEFLQFLIDASERSRRRRDRACAGDRRRARGVARASRLPAGPYVGLGRHLLCAIFLRSRSARRGQSLQAANIRVGGCARLCWEVRCNSPPPCGEG